MMRKSSQWINQWAINLVLEELGRFLTVFDTKRSLDDTARADDGTARNTREAHLNEGYGDTPEWTRCTHAGVGRAYLCRGGRVCA